MLTSRKHRPRRNLDVQPVTPGWWEKWWDLIEWFRRRVAAGARERAIALDEKHGEIYDTGGRLDPISAGGWKWKRRARDLLGRAGGAVRNNVSSKSPDGNYWSDHPVDDIAAVMRRPRRP